MIVRSGLVSRVTIVITQIKGLIIPLYNYPSTSKQSHRHGGSLDGGARCQCLEVLPGRLFDQPPVAVLCPLLGFRA